MKIYGLGKIDMPTEQQEENWEATRILLGKNGCSDKISGRRNYLVYCIDGKAKICGYGEAERRGMLTGWHWTTITKRNLHRREFTYKKDAIECYNKLVELGFKGEGWEW